MSRGSGRGERSAGRPWIEDLVTCPCGKFAYPSRNQAKLSIKRLVKGGGGKGPRDRDALLEPYRCRTSGAWHVGHRRPEGARP